MARHSIIPVDYTWAHPLVKRPVDPLGITIHNAGAVSCTAEGIHAYHKSLGWSGIAYGAFINKKGEIYRGRPIWAVEAHALGGGYWLGICFEGDYERFDKKMPAAQLESGIWLVHRWRDKFHLPKKKIVQHKDMPRNSTACPGQYFPWAALIKGC